MTLEMHLTRSEGEVLENSPELSFSVRDTITALLDASEGGIRLRVADEDEYDRIQAILNPHRHTATGIRSWLLAGLIAGSALLGLAGGPAAAHTNPCSQWGYMIDKEGIVRDSAIMHGAGCDDGPWATRHYDKMDGSCAALARVIVGENPLYWLRRPRILAAAVRTEDAGCWQYEDGTYTR